MHRVVLALITAAFAALSLAAPAAADDAVRYAGVSLQTPDGLPWSAGKPVTVVVSASRSGAVAFPASGVVVVMRTDGDRTKCLEVPLKVVRTEGDRALYAGIFYPFRAAAYDGKVQLGDLASDIRFDVHAMAAGQTAAPVAPQAELPIGTTEEPDGFALPGDLRPFAALGAVLAFAGIGVLLYRRSTPAAVVA